MLGLPFAFTSHFAPAYLDITIEIYREGFQPSETRKAPYVIAAVNLVAADSDKEAKRLFTSTQLRALGMIRGTKNHYTPR
jgi:alkanesulfonate monooxygenase SsuD/methylene tetrahydromethanopterin reductase-like flavin-dependent oxidoreductase (luciferase family)